MIKVQLDFYIRNTKYVNEHITKGLSTLNSRVYKKSLENHGFKLF